MPLDAGGHERMRDLHEERRRTAQEQEQLAIHAPRDRRLREHGIRHTQAVRSFGYALDGIAYLVRTQRNFRIHLLAAAAAASAGLGLGLGATEWAVLALTIAVVIMTEALNTGIELAVTLASPERRPEAKAAKDIAAGAVLLAAIAAVGVGIAIFGPRLVAIFRP